MKRKCWFVFLWFRCSDEFGWWSPPSYCLHCRYVSCYYNLQPQYQVVQCY